MTLLSLGIAQACGSSSEGDGERRRPGAGGTGGHDAGSSGTGNTDAGNVDSSAEDGAAGDAADASGDARPDGSSGAGGSSGSDAGRDAASDARADAPSTLAECEIVSCGGVATSHACCGDIFSFALNASDNPMSSLQTAFTATATSASASFSFTAPDQDGAIGMRLTPSRTPTFIKLTATWTGPVGARPFLTLEAGGTAGCAYDFKANLEADFSQSKFCWGGSFTPETLTIRLESTDDGNATLTVTDIDVR